MQSTSFENYYPYIQYIHSFSSFSSVFASVQCKYNVSGTCEMHCMWLSAFDSRCRRVLQWQLNKIENTGNVWKCIQWMNGWFVGEQNGARDVRTYVWLKHVTRVDFILLILFFLFYFYYNLPTHDWSLFDVKWWWLYLKKSGRETLQERNFIIIFS